MSEKLPPVALLDVNVLYSLYLRDFLLFLATFMLYQPKWSAKISEEWTRNLILKRPDLDEKKVLGVVAQMNTVFPLSQVQDYEGLIPNLENYLTLMTAMYSPPLSKPKRL